MNSIDIIKLYDIILAHELQIPTNFLNIIHSRFSELEHSKVYSILVEDKISIQEARQLMYSKLSEQELFAVKLLNGENAKIITIIN